LQRHLPVQVWRDGQKKRVYVYRFLTTGSIEEKVFQRQISKEGLQSVVGKAGKAVANLATAEELRQLFSLHPETLSDTYDIIAGNEGWTPPGGCLLGQAYCCSGAVCLLVCR
jgi:hypothetical protein